MSEMLESVARKLQDDAFWETRADIMRHLEAIVRVLSDATGSYGPLPSESWNSVANEICDSLMKQAKPYIEENAKKHMYAKLVELLK